MALTQKQVAQQLGVSAGTVARALNGYASISVERRQAIIEGARQLGYDTSTNPEARNLAARRHGKTVRHGAVACLFPDISERALPYYSHLLDGIRLAARRHGIDLMLVETATDSALGKVDGIVGNLNSCTVYEQLRASGLPVVTFMVPWEGFACVCADDTVGMKQAVEHLLELGHRRIAYLVQHQTVSVVQPRIEAYLTALTAAGIVPDPRWLHELKDKSAFFAPRGYESMSKWLEGDWRELGCTALMVQNDHAAIGAMKALREAGLRVPEDVSVVGFDSTHECELVTPSLTSVEVPLREIGAASLALLLSRIENTANGRVEANPAPPSLPTRLCVRDSTAPPCLRK